MGAIDEPVLGAALPMLGNDAEITAQNKFIDQLTRQLNQQSLSAQSIESKDFADRFELDSPLTLNPISPATIEMLADWKPKQQGSNRSTCVAFSVLAMIELAESLETGASRFPDFSEEFLYYSMRINHAGDRDTPGWDLGATYMEHANNALVHDGVCVETIMPYDESPSDPAYVSVPLPSAVTKAKKNRYPSKAFSHPRLLTKNLSKWRRMPLVTLVRKKLEAGLPVAAAFPIYKKDDQWINRYSFGWERGEVHDPTRFASIFEVYENGKMHELAGGHAVCLIGYEPDSNRFLFRNSWGDDFASEFKRAKTKLPSEGYGSISARHLQNHCWELMYFA